MAKLLATWPNALDDVEGILAAQHSGLDLGEVRHLLRHLEEALGRRALVPALETAFARVARPAR